MGVQGLGRLERSARWAVELLRLAVEATTQERPGWLATERLEPESVLATRRQIQRYARDMSFNMAMILIVLLVFLASISLGA